MAENCAGKKTGVECSISAGRFLDKAGVIRWKEAETLRERDTDGK